MEIETLVTGNSSTLFPDIQIDANIEILAQGFSNKIIAEKLFVVAVPNKKSISKEISRNYQEVDIDTIEQIESRNIGGEWLVKQAMDRLVAQLQEIKDKLPKPRALKKTEKVHEKVGKIKAKLSRVGWLYDIEYTEDKEEGIITDITWQRIREREKPKGEYFLRYTKTTVCESDIWNIYNLTRDVEAVFRCLKTDLDIRPIYHQKDEFIEPHIWLGIMAYQIVNYIRIELKNNNINHSWTTIVQKMESMQSSIVSVNNNNNEKIYAKLCSRPTTEQIKIFDALNFKHRPFVRKTKIVPQL